MHNILRILFLSFLMMLFACGGEESANLDPQVIRVVDDEFSPKVITPFQKFYEYYLKNIIPVLGEKIANNRKAYQYLSESIQTFYTPDNFCKLLESKKFHIVNVKKYANGAACLFIASRI